LEFGEKSDIRCTLKSASGLYYKTVTIIIMTIVNDTTIWSATYNHNWRC